MSSGIGFQELVLLFVLGLLFLGPERLPRVATQIGRWVGRARRTANQLRYQLEREIALADIEKSTKKRENQTKAAGAEKSETEAGAKPAPQASDEASGEETIAKPEEAETASEPRDDTAGHS